MNKLLATATLLLCGLPQAVAAVASSSCGRLSTGDTFNDLNKILDCIEAKATGQPATAASDGSGYVEELEPNDRIGDANPIALETTVRGRIRKDNEFDIFRFTAPSSDGGVRIIIRQTQTSGFYPVVRIHDHLQVQIAKEQGSRNQTISVPLEAEAGRDYYITITCKLGCDEKDNDYELVVKPE